MIQWSSGVQWSSSGAAPLRQSSGVVECAAPYRRPHVLHYSHTMARSSGLADSEDKEGPNRGVVLSSAELIRGKDEKA